MHINRNLACFFLAMLVFMLPCGCSNGSYDNGKDIQDNSISSETNNSLSEKSSSLPWNVNADSDNNLGILNPIPESRKVDFDFFDDAVFVGDSVTLKLKYYVTERRSIDPSFMGKAQFLCSGSLGSANSLWEVSQQSVHPSYKGEKRLIEDSIAQINAKKIYIMLGINDVAAYGVEDSVKNISELIDRILNKSSDLSIYVQSVTPIVNGKELTKFNNKSIQEYNNVLSKLCVEKGYNFLDVASVMEDEEGFLKSEYCSDVSGPNSLGIHFTTKACEIWLDYLLTHTK